MRTWSHDPLDTGTFKYDGAGNVTEMRLSPSVADVFTYDRLSRLKTSTFGTVAGSPTESFLYDGDQEKGFGNLISRVYQGGTTALPVNMATNRLSTASYDSRGLMTVYASDGFTYDARNRRTRYAFNSQETETYLYAPNDERVVKRVATSSLPTADPGSLRYFPVTPCRILDTRNAVGTYGGPSLTGQQERSFPTVGTCGIPSKASALALTVTAVPKAGSTLTNGSLGAWRSDLGYRPNTLAAVVNPARTRATLAIIGLSGTGAFKLFPDIPASEAVDAVVDVSGYFAPPVAAPSSGKSWLITYRDTENHPVAEYRVDEDRSGVILPQRFHVYLGNTLVATREEAFSPAYGGLWSFFSSDHLGTPRLRTGVLGSGQSAAPVLETYRYRAFGAKFPSLVQPDRDGREFASMERDIASGNHYVHARFFSDYPARFLSPDQVNGRTEDPQSWNRYSYCFNNPIRLIDPDGRAASEPGVFARAYQSLTNFFRTVFSPGSPVQPSMQAAERLATMNASGAGAAEATSVAMEAANVQAGLVEAHAVLATEVTVAASTQAAASGAGLIMRGAADVLSIIKPDEKYIGQAGSSTTIRTLVGGAEGAEGFFARLSAGGKTVAPKNFSGRMVELADGTRIAIRETSRSGPPTVTVQLPGANREIKLKFVENL